MAFPTLVDCSLRAKQQAFSAPNGKTDSLAAINRFPATCLVRGRRPAAAAALQQQKALAKSCHGKSHDSSSTESNTSRQLHQAAVGMTASGLAAIMLMCPGHVLAEEVPQATAQDAQVRRALLDHWALS